MSERRPCAVADDALHAEQMQQSVAKLSESVLLFRDVFQRAFLHSKLAEGVPGVPQEDFDELEQRLARVELASASRAVQVGMRDLSVDTYLPFLEKEIACPFALLGAQHDAWRTEMRHIVERQPDKRTQKALLDESAAAAGHKKSKSFSLRRGGGGGGGSSFAVQEVASDLARVRELRLKADEMAAVLERMQANVDNLARAACALGNVGGGGREWRVVSAFSQYAMLDETVLRVLDSGVARDLSVPNGDLLLDIGQAQIEVAIKRVTMLQGYDRDVATERIGRIRSGAEAWLTETLGAAEARAVLPPVWSLRPDTLAPLDEADAQHQRSRVMRRVVPQIVGLLDIVQYTDARDRVIKLLIKKFV